MQSHIISSSTAVSPLAIRALANGGALDEISNSAGSVRFHLFHHGLRDKTTGVLQKSMLFAIYQTGRHGPQNGYRLCLVHEGYRVTSPTKDEGEAEDEIDALEKEIPQGHEEIVILGERPADWENGAWVRGE